jgi:hypothetical protein
LGRIEHVVGEILRLLPLYPTRDLIV